LLGGPEAYKKAKAHFIIVTNMDRSIDLLEWFYRQRAGAENLSKEANNDAGLAAHPSGRWAANCVHFQLVMLAFMPSAGLCRVFAR
jgi:hypothetical protein